MNNFSNKDRVKKDVSIRKASLEDASQICRLSEELGYPATVQETDERLQQVLASGRETVLTAFLPQKGIIGWLHVFKAVRIESGDFAEIGGFVVAGAYRRCGIGKKLFQAAEAWSHKKGLPKLRVRSRIEREDAKEFYLNMGFSISKQQRVFDKKLSL